MKLHAKRQSNCLFEFRNRDLNVQTPTQAFEYRVDIVVKLAAKLITDTDSEKIAVLTVKLLLL